MEDHRSQILPSQILLTDRVAVVTGGAAGIGRGIATGMAAFGAAVAILDLDGDGGERVAGAIRRAGGRAIARTTDVRDGEAVRAALDAAADELGGLDILVNNAGGVFAQPFVESREKGWDALWRANLKSVLHCTRIGAERMIAQGRGGSVVNVVSIEGVRAAPLYAVYAAAKAGAISFTRTMALELAPHGIRVNALAPDICRTEGLEAMMPPESLDRARSTVPLGRLGEPRDLAGAAIFLSSPMASYLTGQVLHVDGGTHAAGGWYHDPEDGHYVYGPGAPRS